MNTRLIRTTLLLFAISIIIVACSSVPKTLKETTLDDFYPILTSEQYDSLSSLNDPADILMYLESYWLSVDPTPGTIENEFRHEYAWRLQYSKDHFPDLRGWGRSDRKRIFLIYGAPASIERAEYTDVQISTFASLKSIEIWRYLTPANAGYFSSRGNQIYPGERKFIFADLTGTGVYKLLYSSEEGGDIDSRFFN